MSTSHITKALQSLDQSFFKPLKTYIAQEATKIENWQDFMSLSLLAMPGARLPLSLTVWQVLRQLEYFLITPKSFWITFFHFWCQWLTKNGRLFRIWRRIYWQIHKSYRISYITDCSSKQTRAFRTTQNSNEAIKLFHPCSKRAIRSCFSSQYQIFCKLPQKWNKQPLFWHVQKIGANVKFCVIKTKEDISDEADEYCVKCGDYNEAKRGVVAMYRMFQMVPRNM